MLFWRNVWLPGTIKSESGRAHSRNLTVRDLLPIVGPLSQEWIDTVESLFLVHETPVVKKVDIATFYLRGEAKKWWKQVRRVYTLDEFKTMLSARFYPEALRKRKMQEFLDLRQGSLTVQEYTDRFNDLAPYAKAIVPTELDLTERYESGFNDTLASLVVGNPTKTFNEAYNRALSISTGYLARKAVSSASTPSSFKRAFVPFSASGPAKRAKFGGAAKPPVPAKPVGATATTGVRKCFRCQKDFHPGFNCDGTSYVCYRCKKPGH